MTVAAITAKSNSPISVMVVDDHLVAREGLRAILEQEADIKVVIDLSSGEAAASAWKQHKPDVTIMDLRLQGIDGLTAIRRIRKEHAAAKFIILTTHEGDEPIHQALEDGARGYLFKDMVRGELVTAVRAVAAGKRYVPPAVSNRLLEFTPRVSLTPRERDVIRLVAEGLGNREIGDRLKLSEFTVKGHMQSVLSKLGASDRAQAVMIAVQRGFIHT